MSDKRRGGLPETTDTTLGEFNNAPDIPKPLIKRKRVYWSPTHEDKPCGFVGKEYRRRLTCYATRRKGSHYYHKGKGFAISDSIIAKLRSTGVTHVYVHRPAEGSGDVYEFALKQFVFDGKAVPKADLQDSSDPQTYMATADSLNVWRGHAGDMYVRTFDEAMDDCLK